MNKLTLYASNSSGGLGLPNLQAYYQAAQITQLSYTTAKGSPPLWVSIEALSCHPNVASEPPSPPYFVPHPVSLLSSLGQGATS